MLEIKENHCLLHSFVNYYFALKIFFFFFLLTGVDGDRQRGHRPGDRRGGQKVVWIPGGPATESSCG